MSAAPLARRDEFLAAQQVADEFVIYDLESNRVHHLNPTAALIWRWSDGRTPAEALTGRLARELGLSLKEAEPLFWLAMSRLEEANLLESAPQRPLHFRSLSRRNTIRILAGATLLPVIYTIAAPTAAHAQSNCLGQGAECDLQDDNCCSGLVCCDRFFTCVLPENCVPF